MATFRFAEDDVHAEEVQVRIFIADTGPESRLNRRGAEKEPALADKNGCLVADATMLGKMGVDLRNVGEVCFHQQFKVMANGSEACFAGGVTRGTEAQTKDGIVTSIRNTNPKKFRESLQKYTDKGAVGGTPGHTVVFRIRDIPLYKIGDRPGGPTDVRSFTVEVGLVGEESYFQTLRQHGLVPDDTDGIVITAKFTPQGGYDVKRFGKCIAHQFEGALQPYFTDERPKVLAVSAAHPFGVQAVRQATHAVLVTVRVPEGQGLFKLPTSIPTPTGRFDHASHHAEAGQVPQHEETNIKWYVKGHNVSDGTWEVNVGPPESEQVKYQQVHGPAKPTRATRRLCRYENGVKRLPVGADTSHLQSGWRTRPGRSAPQEPPRRSRSRSRSPAPDREGASGKRPALPSARPALTLGFSTTGPHAVSAGDADLFTGVPGLEAGGNTAGTPLEVSAAARMAAISLRTAAASPAPAGMPVEDMDV